MKSSTYKTLWIISENLSYLSILLCAASWIFHIWTDSIVGAKSAWTFFVLALLGFFMYSWYKDEWKKAKKRENL